MSHYKKENEWHFLPPPFPFRSPEDEKAKDEDHGLKRGGYAGIII
jgi:hypothetical protein